MIIAQYRLAIFENMLQNQLAVVVLAHLLFAGGGIVYRRRHSAVKRQ